MRHKHKARREIVGLFIFPLTKSKALGLVAMLPTKRTHENYRPHQMTHCQILAILTEWKRRHDALDAVFESLRPALGSDPESPLWKASWDVFTAYTSALSQILDDEDGWLEYYWLENNWGAKGYEVGYDGKLKPLKTLGNLAALLVLQRKRQEKRAKGAKA